MHGHETAGRRKTRKSPGPLVVQADGRSVRRKRRKGSFSRSYVTEPRVGSSSAAALCCLSAGYNQTVPLLCVSVLSFFVFQRGGAELRPAGGGWGWDVGV